MEYLTIPQFAERMQVDERTVQRWVAAKAIKYIRINRTVRIPASQLAQRETVVVK